MSQSVAIAVIALTFIAPVRGGEADIAGNAQISGTWRGNSECVLKNGPCHDETNVYRFSEITARPGWFSCTGSKIVNGVEIAMGTLDWQYDAKKHVLKSKNPSGTFFLMVDGDKIEGTLVLADATVYRRIHLTKVR